MLDNLFNRQKINITDYIVKLLLINIINIMLKLYFISFILHICIMCYKSKIQINIK